jgi:superfamily II RNA helicase
LAPAEAVAVLSTLIFEEKDASEAALTPALSEAIEKTRHIAVALAQIQARHGLQVTANDVLSRINLGLVEVVYEWAREMVFNFFFFLVFVFFFVLKFVVDSLFLFFFFLCCSHSKIFAS